MSIGGMDIILKASKMVSPADLILRVCLRHWRDGVFQDANEHQRRPLGDRGEWFRETACNEFFIYQDEKSASSWEEHGAVAENQNMMIHFLLNDLDELEGMREVTIVCDSLEGTVLEIINEIRASFLDKTFNPKQELREAA